VRLLDAAAALFAARGIDAVSVDAVADAAGRTSGAVYDHFGSKQALLLALLDEWKHSLVSVVSAEFSRSNDVEERVRAVARNVVVHPSPQTTRLLLLERELWLRAARDAKVAAAMRSRGREAHRRMARGFTAWVSEGVIAGDTTPDTLATRFSAMVVGLEMQHRIDPGAVNEEQATAALLSLLCPRVRAPALATD
jgi:AcrR family transcriptional regulator